MTTQEILQLVVWGDGIEILSQPERLRKELADRLPGNGPEVEATVLLLQAFGARLLASGEPVHIHEEMLRALASNARVTTARAATVLQDGRRTWASVLATVEHELPGPPPQATRPTRRSISPGEGLALAGVTLVILLACFTIGDAAKSAGLLRPQSGPEPVAVVTQVSAPPAPPTAVAPLPSTPQAVRPFLVLAGCFREPARATAQASRLRTAGFTGTEVIMSNDFRGLRPGYHVALVGAFADLDGARVKANEVQSKGFESYVARIKP